MKQKEVSVQHSLMSDVCGSSPALALMVLLVTLVDWHSGGVATAASRKCMMLQIKMKQQKVSEYLKNKKIKCAITLTARRGRQNSHTT